MAETAAQAVTAALFLPITYGMTEKGDGHGRRIAGVRRGAGVRRSAVTAIVPAYNEASTIADTVRSLWAQTVPPVEVIVVDDCSTDGTGDQARACGATVVRPPANTGSKAGSQGYALGAVRTEFTVVVDADTVLEPDAVERLLAALEEPGVAAACGFVLPQRVRTIWERGRYIEYMLVFTWYKPIQDYYEKPLISSGCFSAYRTDEVRACGGWSTRTVAEDVDLTWSLYRAGYGVRFVPQAICYPVEPHSFAFMWKQLRRWSHGFTQNVMLHWRDVLGTRYLRSVVAVAMSDALLASLGYLVLLPLLALLLENPLILLGYVIDVPAIVIPVLLKAVGRREVRRALASLPAFFLLRIVNAVHLCEAVWAEVVLRRPLSVYEKGH
jgi:cellulose synthase/poly-beta-1,6-N-acetylglucosamine synthase-like glycosyltransferase